jgi:hypothetical protein
VPSATSRKRNPLLEVLGFACDDPSRTASDVWAGYLASPTTMVCSFQRPRPGDNGERFCHKSSAAHPISVCAMAGDDSTVVTCPYRFEESELIFDHAWRFLVGNDASAAMVRQVDAEIRLVTTERKQIGNADFVVSALDPTTGTRTLCTIEVQAVYNTGNTREIFEKFINSAARRRPEIDWSTERLPRPDFLSSWKRLRSQLLDKGPDLAKAGIKQVVVVDTWFLGNLRPRLCAGGDWSELAAPVNGADVAIFGYDLVKDSDGRLRLTRRAEVYTTLALLRPALERGGALDLVALNQTLTDRLARRRAMLATANARLVKDANEGG